MKGKGKKVLTEQEVNKLLLYVSSQADKARRKGTSRAIIDELLIHLLLYAGLRPNELCDLRIKDLPIIHNQNSIWIRNSKNDILRKIIIPEELINLTTRFVSLYIENNKPEDPLLQSERGNPFSYFSIYNKVHKIGIDAGIKGLSTSLLRQTYIVRLFNSEQDLRYVQQQTGYASCRALQKYITSNKSANRQVCEACENIIENGKGIRIDSGQLLCQNCYKYFKN